MRAFFGLALFVSVASCVPEEPSGAPLSGSIAEYGRTGSGPLRGVLYLPPGHGPFPVLLYAHGSAPGSLSNTAFEAIAPAFTSRGWALFAPYRRGQGLSREAGPYLRAEIETARMAGGMDRAQARLAELLATDHMADHSQALVWLSRQPFAAPGRIATMGNSFGGIIALLSAQRLPVCAAVDAAGGAESWKDSPDLRALMRRSAVGARAPVLFIQARNDFDLAPSPSLHSAMRKAGKPAAMRLYPAHGRSARQGHAFPYTGVGEWASDVHAFLEAGCRPRGPNAAVS